MIKTVMIALLIVVGPQGQQLGKAKIMSAHTDRQECRSQLDTARRTFETLLDKRGWKTGPGKVVGYNVVCFTGFHQRPST